MKFERETEFIEFKESLSQLSRALESIAAMINKHGKAVVYFGVKDDGSVVGVSLGNKTLKDISSEIHQRIKPVIVPKITEEKHENKIVIKVEAKGTNTPYSSDGNYFIRTGNENRKITPEIMRQLIFKNSNDNIVEIESSNQDLTFNQLSQLYILKGLSINKNTFLQNIGLLNKSKNFNLLANLLSDNNDISIKVVRFKGTDKTEIISRNEFGYKCLALALQNALDYTMSFNETKVDMSSTIRKETHLFNESALREAWVNACLHTRWDKMIPPAIYIFDDRIEIISTGGLPIDCSIEEFYKGISHPINKNLQKIFGQLGLVEQTGHGIPEIIKHYGKEAFNISENNINIIFKFPYTLNRGETNYSGLNPSQIKVLKAINIKPSVTTNELCKITSLGTTRINVIVKELKQLNRIKRVGSNKTGYWLVLNK
ncbi:MAG: putative DNA binding domain-containing protein [Bacilli bacterium]|nr:putative DNA binding domain-containing protein [Bacilli bacterium]